MNRRQLLKRSATVLSVSALSALSYDALYEQTLEPLRYNPNLKTIWKDWALQGGNPIDDKHLFLNMDVRGYEKNSFERFKQWKALKNTYADVKDNQSPRQQIPVIKDPSFLNSVEDMVVLLGHATVFVRLKGIQILIDPVLGDLPVPYLEFMNPLLRSAKRFSEFPIDIDLLNKIDYVLISHAHYDHCDKASLKYLSALNPNMTVLTGLRVGSLMKGWFSNINRKPKPMIQEAGWFQRYETNPAIEIVFVPACHWANRGLNDINHTLWGGFVIKNADKTIFFSGDTGYGNGTHFKVIGNLFPNIDLALIGAGAFAPTWFMKSNHQEPKDTVQAFKDCKAKRLIPFHFGTFDLSDEPLNEPAVVLNHLQKEGHISKDELIMVDLGQVIKF